MQWNNKDLQYVWRMCALENCLSPSGLNLKRIKGEYDLSMSELMLRPHNMIRYKMNRQYNDNKYIPGEEWIISVVLELMDCERGLGTCGLNYYEICDLFESICLDWLLYDMCCI